MSTGELVFLALVVGCFAAFAVAVIWLRADYVKHAGRRSSAAGRIQAQMAE